MKNAFCYQLVSARKSVGLTQEQASELLGVEVRTLSGYENGSNVHDDIIARMTVIYQSPELGYEWLRQLKTGNLLLPKIESNKLPENVLTLLSVQNNAKSYIDDLINISCDGKVDKDEAPLFKNITIKYLRPIIKTGLSLLFYPIKKAELHKQFSK